VPQPKDKDKLLAWLMNQKKQAASDDELKSADREEAYKLYLGRELGKPKKGQPAVVSSDCFDAVESILPDLMEIFASSDEPVTIKPRTIADREAALANRQLIKYQLERLIPWFLLNYSCIKSGLIYRNGYMRWGWDYRWRWDEKEYVSIAQDDLDAILSQGGEVLAGEPIIDPMTGRQLGLRDAKVKERKVIKDQPLLEVLPPWNLLVSPDAPDIESAPFVAVRDFPTLDQVRRDGEMLKYFNLDQLTTGVETPGEEAAHHHALGYGDPRQAEEIDPLRGRVERWTCYVMWDTGDGKLAPMIATLVGDTLVGWQDNVFETPPIEKWSPILDLWKLQGISIIDITKEFQHVKTTLWRTIMSQVAHQNAPQWLAERGSGLDINALLSGRPRSVTFVDEGKAASVRALERQPIGSDTWQYYGVVDAMKEQRLGVTRLNQGLDAETLNKTARGMLSLMRAAQKRIRLIARLYAESLLKKIFRRLIWLNQNFVDRELVINLTEGEDIAIHPDMLGGNLDLIVNVGLGTSDNEVTIQQGMQLLQILSSLASSPGGQAMVSPENIYQTVRRIIEAMGWSAAAHITDPANVQGAQPNGQIPSGPGPGGGLPATAGAGPGGGPATAVGGLQPPDGALPGQLSPRPAGEFQGPAAWL